MSANIESVMPGDEENKMFKQLKQNGNHTRRSIINGNISNDKNISITVSIKMSISKQHE